MFVGTVPSVVREIIRQIAAGWRTAPIYVGCSGNFTIESAVGGLPRELHSNDVSLYSGAIGALLTGQGFPLSVKHDPLEWLEQYLGSPIDKVATLVLCLEYLPAAFRQELPFFRRQWLAVEKRWADLHQGTVEKVRAATAKMNIASYTPMDVVDYVEQVVPAEAGVMAFPPTYKSGYERLFKSLDATFEWQAPSYTIFDDDRMARLVTAITSKRHWALYSDKDIPGLAANLVGMAQQSAKSHPVRIYASSGDSRLVMPHQKLEPVNIPRLSGKIGGKIELVPLSQGQLNTLRSEYLAGNIIPVGAHARFAVASDGELIGAMAFSPPNYLGEWCDAYMMTDLAIAPTQYARLSKLVLAAVLSVEVKEILSQRFVKQVKTIGTTAFTDKAVSMKYRGAFDLHSRKPGKLNYIADAGRWTLAEGLQWWMRQYGQTLRP